MILDEIEQEINNISDKDYREAAMKVLNGLRKYSGTLLIPREGE
jgi:hypothetical protein